MRRLALLALGACIVPAPPQQPQPDPEPDLAPDPVAVADPDAVPDPDADPDPVPVPVAAIDLTAHPPCVEIAEVRPDLDDKTWGPVARDLARHIEHDGPWIADDISSAVHESTHLMNTQITRAYGLTWGKGNGFYMLDSCGVLLLTEPGVRKSDVIPYLPETLRGLRYGQYITGQESWDDVPTYLFDEWVAYTNGAAAGLDQRAHGLWPDDDREDTMAGQVEFTLYGIALGMAVRDLDAGYLTSEPAFWQLLAWNAQRSLDQYRAGKDDSHWPSEEQDALYDQLRTGADGQAMRDFLRAIYGDAFTATLLDVAP